MAIKIRSKDDRLVGILQDYFQDYLKTSVPDDVFENAVNVLLKEVRNTSRRAENILKIDESFCWDKKNHQLFYENKEIELTNKENEFLSLLFSDINRGFSYEVIFMELWYDTKALRHPSLKTLVKQLRRKLPKDIIKNLFGFGYKIEIA